MPRIISKDVVERTNAKGTALFYTTVCAEFDVVSAKDGSSHTVCTYGEAMDSGDKATNKAMSAAYKYAAFQAFAIPTEGDNDADHTTHDVKAPCIDADKVATLTALADEVKADMKAFLKFFSITTIEEMPTLRYSQAVQMLQSKRKSV